jgi:hypothetical protein
MISRVLKRAWPAFAFSIVGFVGCNTLIGANDPILRQEDSSVGQACVLNSDCSTVGQFCIFRVCSPQCHTDGDCTDASRCLQTQMGTACVANAVAACFSDQACPAGSFCQSGFCRNTCDGSRACLSGQQCVRGTCVGNDPAHDPGIDAGMEAGLDAATPSDAVDDRAVQGADASDAVADAVQDNAVAIDDRGDAVGDATTDVVAEAGCGDTTSDVHHCGACDRDCTKLPNVSASGLVCSGGHCVYQCAAGHADCADAGAGCQTDLSMSPNCGACGTACPAAIPLCAPATPGGFSCQSGCPSSAPTLCGMACVDLTNSDGNCSACGTPCAGGRHCMSGACQCTGGTHLCGNQCVANDTNACGPSCAVCTAPAGGTVTCNGTQCVQSCTTGGYTACSNACVNEATDPANCGMCANACTGGTPVCVNSGCVQCTSGMQCGPSNTPQSCIGNQWVNQTQCSGTLPVCTGGNCVACTSGTQCNGTNTAVQVCIGNMWQTQTTCTASQVCRAATCVNAIHPVGQSTALSGSSALVSDTLYIFRLPPLTHDATLLSFGTYGNASGSSAKLVLYSDNGSGSPGTYVASTSNPLLLTNGQVEQGTTPANVTLFASTTYWLGILVSVNTTIYSTPNAATVGKKVGLLYGSPPPWPASPTGPANSGVDFAIYISVQDLN